MRASLACVVVLLAASSLIACEAGRSPWEHARAPDRSPAPVTEAPAPAPRPLTEPEADEERQIEPVVERGSGVLAGRPPGRARASIATDAGEVTLNVVDADLREVVRLVLEDTLGANYVIDPAVEGRITVQTSRPVPVEDLVPMLDAVLRVNGAAVVEAGEFYQIVPIDRALTSGAAPDVRPLPDAGRQGFGVRVVPLRFVSATQMTELIAPFAPSGGNVQADPVRNLLLLAGSSDQLATLSDLVAIFDVDWLQGMSFGLFPLETADAEQLVAELQEVFGLVEEGPLTGVLRFVPIERLNAVLVISAQPTYIDQAETWIERLDQAAPGAGRRVYVYPVQNGRASDLAEVLGQLFDLESARVGEPDLLAPGLEEAELGSLLESQMEFDEGAGPEPTEPPTQRSSPTQDQLGAQAFGRGDSGIEGDVRIIADATTNSLVIRAVAEDYRKIESALEQLDILPLQVLIEATIAEVSLRDELRYGVEWFFRFGEQEFTLSDAADGAVSSTFPGFSALFTSSDDVRLVIDALESVSDVNIISSPQLMVLDNQTAQLQVGDEVPIITRQTQSTIDVDAPVVNTVEQRQTGVILSVTPRVNASGLVLMEIQQEVSDVIETTTSGIDSPTISQRRIASTVAVQSGETVALGGLIEDGRQDDTRGVPLASRIPVVGWLFGRTATSSERTELLVLITPRVVRDPNQARAVTEELRQRLRGLAPLRGRVR